MVVGAVSAAAAAAAAVEVAVTTVVCETKDVANQGVTTFTGATDILSWRNMGSQTDGYINGLNLQLTDALTPAYYVTVRAVNGAGDVSPPMTSNPIEIVQEDEAGSVLLIYVPLRIVVFLSLSVFIIARLFFLFPSLFLYLCRFFGSVSV